VPDTSVPACGFADPRNARRTLSGNGRIPRRCRPWVLLPFAVIFAGCGSEPAPREETVAAGEALAGAAAGDPPPERLDPERLDQRRFGEAPALAARVERGELPPVDQRLPENPKVVRPIEEIGVDDLHAGILGLCGLGLDLDQDVAEGAERIEHARRDAPLAEPETDAPIVRTLRRGGILHAIVFGPTDRVVKENARGRAGRHGFVTHRDRAIEGL